jgi:hypothetical protein
LTQENTNMAAAAAPAAVDPMDLPWDERPYVPPVIPGFKTPKLDMSKPLPPREPMSPAAIEYERRKNLPEPWNAQTIRKVIAEGPDGPDLHRYKGKEGEGDHFAIKHQHTAMWYAAKLGLWDEVLQLLDMGADPQAMDEYEYTALMWAARADRMDVIKKLLDKGADIDQMTQYGWTSVMWAKKYQPDAGVAEKLIEMGAAEKLPLPWEDGCPDRFNWKIRREKKEAARRAAMTQEERDQEDRDKEAAAKQKVIDDAERDRKFKEYLEEMKAKAEAEGGASAPAAAPAAEPVAIG